MSQYKHICELSWCKIHSKCIFHNAEYSLKTDAYKVTLGYVENADIILCYQKEDIGLERKQEQEPIVVKEPSIRRIEDSDDSWKVYQALKRKTIESKSEKQLCENPKCKAGNPSSVVFHNNDIHLCKDCNDIIHYWKTNHDLARYFNSKYKIIKLLSCIRELEKETNEKPNEVIRCINIYCGTSLNITQHHLIPKPFRKGISGRIERVPLCENCHRQVHRMKTNTQLANHYNTKQSIIELLGSDVQFRAERLVNSLSEYYQYRQMVA